MRTRFTALLLSLTTLLVLSSQATLAAPAEPPPLEAPESLTVQIQTDRGGFDTLLFTYIVPERVTQIPNVDFRIEMKENEGPWITADTECPDPTLDPIFTQNANGSLNSVFYRHGVPGYLAPEQNNYEFRACFAIGNMARSPYSNTVSIGYMTPGEPGETNGGAGAEKTERKAMGMEGPGFDTPEQAAQAYLDALKRADVDEMISTFAMETYVEHFDFEKYLGRVKAYTLSMEQRLPPVNDFSKGINLAQRRGNLATAICRQYLTLLALFAEDANITKILEGGVLPLTEEETGELVRALANPEYLQTLGTLRLVEFVPPAQLSDQYDSERNRENIAARAAAFGADELTDVAARVEIGGRRYLFFFDVARYGDRWYNLDHAGNLSNLMGVSVSYCGILPEE